MVLRVVIIAEELSLSTRAELHRSMLYSSVNKEQLVNELEALQESTKYKFYVDGRLTFGRISVGIHCQKSTTIFTLRRKAGLIIWIWKQ